MMGITLQRVLVRPMHLRRGQGSVQLSSPTKTVLESRPNWKTGYYI